MPKQFAFDRCNGQMHLFRKAHSSISFANQSTTSSYSCRLFLAKRLREVPLFSLNIVVCHFLPLNCGKRRTGGPKMGAAAVIRLDFERYIKVADNKSTVTVELAACTEHVEFLNLSYQ